MLIMNSSGEELVQVTLNNAGEDFMVVVSLETANILLNDPNEASKFISASLTQVAEPQISEKVVQVGEIQQTKMVDMTIESGEEMTSFYNCGPSSSSNIWLSKRPSDLDNEATKYFLTLRRQYNAKFSDKKTTKNQIWGLIAKKMNEMGYYIGVGKESMEKCRMKFANLQKSYLSYIKHQKTTGVEKKDPPPFFDDMHDILGDKDMVDPKNMQDTESDMETPEVRSPLRNDSVDTEEKEFEECDLENTPKNRFTGKRSIRPKSTNQQLFELLRDQHQQNRYERKQEFKELQNLLEVQNQQRERLLNQFDKFLDLKTTKKRKRESSSSSSE